METNERIMLRNRFLGIYSYFTNSSQGSLTLNNLWVRTGTDLAKA